MFIDCWSGSFLRSTRRMAVVAPVTPNSWVGEYLDWLGQDDPWGPVRHLEG